MSENLPAPVAQPSGLPGFYGAAVTGDSRHTITGVLKKLAQQPDASWTYCSIPKEELTGVKGAARMLRLLKGPAKTIKEVLNTPVAFVHLLMHPGKFLDDDSGEVTGRMPRVLLITQDDEVVSAGSWGVIEQLDMLISAGLTPPWNPPLKMKWRAVDLSEGKQTYNLELIVK